MQWDTTYVFNHGRSLHIACWFIRKCTLSRETVIIQLSYSLILCWWGIAENLLWDDRLTLLQFRNAAVRLFRLPIQNSWYFVRILCLKISIKMQNAPRSPIRHNRSLRRRSFIQICQNIMKPERIINEYF